MPRDTGYLSLVLLAQFTLLIVHVCLCLELFIQMTSSTTSILRMTHFLIRIVDDVFFSMSIIHNQISALKMFALGWLQSFCSQLQVFLSSLDYESGLFTQTLDVRCTTLISIVRGKSLTHGWIQFFVTNFHIFFGNG